MAAPRDKRSPIWQYFEVCEQNDAKAVCMVCKESVSRGGSKRKSYNTTNLRKHLEQHHMEKYKELVETEQREKSRKRTREEVDKGQPRIDETLDARNPYNPSSERYLAITRAVACMMISDFQPFSIVEDEGFRHLIRTLDRRYQLPSRKHFSEKVIPQMYAELRVRVGAIVKSATCLALTTDGWTSRAGDSYLSVTAHFIDDSYKRQLVVLDTFPFCERHTAHNLLSSILTILDAWEIEKNRITCFVKDNAANITAAVREGDFANIGCVDHTLQLAISDGLKVEAVMEILKIVRAIVGHFHRLPAARQLLKNAQTQLQLPKHQLSQEVCTRWNSTFYMLHRFAEQRRAVISVLPETTCSAELTMTQWNIVNQLVLLLGPFEEFSREFEREDATVGLIIPGIRILLKHLGKPVATEESSVVRNTRSQILSSLDTRFSGVEAWDLHSMATLLDPRFKVKGFSSATFVEMVKSKVLEKAKEIAESSSETTGSVEEQECQEVVSSKKKKHATLWEEFDRDDLDCPITMSQGEREIEQYLGISRLPHSEDPVKFWRSHGTHFPQLAPLSRKVLAIPPTSADSERVLVVQAIW